MKYLRVVLLLFIIIVVISLVGEGNTGNLSNHKAAALDCPQIDETTLAIFPSDCNAPDGKIVGITATGGSPPYRYIWTNGEKDIVSNTADLQNVAPGTYTLQVLDQSKCITTKKQYTVGEKNAVVFDDSQTQITPSGCTPNGSITHINAENAVQYSWQDPGGAVISTTVDLTGVVSGNYTLTATNATGCTAQKVYSVLSTISYPKITHIDTLVGACAGSPGTIEMVFAPQPSDPTYNWNVYGPSGNAVATGVIAYSPSGPAKVSFSLPEANTDYRLVLTTPNFCQILAGNFSLPQPVLTILTNSPFFLVRNDACGRATGGVFEVKVTGGTAPESPYGNPPNQSWVWTDSLGSILSRVPNLVSATKGTYTLTITDIKGCVATQQFTVLDSVGEAAPPGVNGVTLCLPGTATLSVINPSSAYKYRLYDSTQTAITENSYGTFQQTVSQTSKFYVTTLNGLCESDKTEVTVNVVAPGVIIPNTFTPNNDGINDLWEIPHIDEFPGADVTVFNREGQIVYHSIDYSHPFNGKYNGKELPNGVYYYVIDLKKPECLGKVSGSITLIR